MPPADRTIVKNYLYKRPDTGEVQTTIEVERGCPGRCIYCLAPIMYGRVARYRKIDSVIEEIRISEEFGIRNFFFKADEFTLNKKFVIELSKKIVQEGLDIEWVTNSRVDTIDRERIYWMEKSGNWLLAFGFETGSNESKKKIGKFTTIQQDIKARKLAEEFGIYVYGFFMIGFPWERLSDIKTTLAHMFRLNSEFIELHIPVPYYGTKLYHIMKASGLIDDVKLGVDYFINPPVGTKYVSKDILQKIRSLYLKKYYMRPNYIAKMLSKDINPKKWFNYFRYGLKTLVI